MEGKGGEFGIVDIIYFVSRTGGIEQPHLIRVTHLHNNGLYLRDVKRWLSDMPHYSFSWFYKRRHGKGYVWQHLQDDDLITPLSANQFVLKASLILPSSHDHCLLHNEKKWCSIKEQYQRNMSGKNSSISTPSSMDDGHVKVRGRASLFRKLLTCGKADTNDSVLVTRPNNQPPSQICKLGAQQNPRRSHDVTKKQRQSHNKPVCAPYRSLRRPTCSQCGREFKPEKLHKHMKSCKGVARNGGQKHKSTNTESPFTHLLTNSPS